MSSVIKASGLKVAFNGRFVLDGLSLSIEKGTVCALLGPNGAGKTTLIRTIVNIYEPRSGTSSIFGISSTKLSENEFARIGYVSENQDVPLWMRVDKFLDFCSGFYPTWDHAWCQKKLEEFELPRNVPLAKLSRGMRTKAILLSSLAYHPELLILDEPFSGLDPIVRDEFIDLVIELAGDNQATTLISSHDLGEVERIADTIAFLSNGKISCHMALDELLSKFKRVTLEVPDGVRRPEASWLGFKREGDLVHFVETDFDKEGMQRKMGDLSDRAVLREVRDMSLKEIYRALAGREVN